MKLNKTNILTFLAGGSLVAAAMLLMDFRDVKNVIHERPEVSAMIMTPTIPNEVTFCDQKLDISRYNMHEGLERELTSFCYFHSTTMRYFKRANRYFPIIEPILKAKGIPDDFKYLAVIESGMDPRTSSPVGAVGLWQFMRTTAKEYGLSVGLTVDERSDVVKSTQAACAYLKDAYKRYGNWYNVAASYNAGMGRVSSELKRQHAENALNLWLVSETRRYVYRILAIKQVFEHPYKYGFIFQAKDLYKPFVYTVDTVRNIKSLADYAQTKGIYYTDLKRLNPWLRNRMLRGGTQDFFMHIPVIEEMSYKKPNRYVHNPNWVVK